MLLLEGQAVEKTTVAKHIAQGWKLSSCIAVDGEQPAQTTKVLILHLLHHLSEQGGKRLRRRDVLGAQPRSDLLREDFDLLQKERERRKIC